MSYERNDSIQGYRLPPPPGANTKAGQVRPESNFRGVSDVQKWKTEDWMKIEVLSLVLRALALLFSFLTFIILVTIKKFTIWDDLSYLFSIGLIMMVYTAVLTGMNGHEIKIGDVLISHKITLWINFLGDQCLALMILSSASCASSLVREYSWYKDFGQAKGAIAMAFLGFISLESSALISGYNLAVHSSKI